MAVQLQPGARVLQAKTPRELNRQPQNAAFLPQLPLGGEDARRRGGLGRIEEVAITREPVSRVFHYAAAVLRKELKALQLKVEQKRALVQR